MFEEARKESFEKDGDGDLCGRVIHAPDADSGLIQIRVHLEIVAVVDGKRDGDLFKPTLGQGVHAGASHRDRGQGLQGLIVNPSKVGDDTDGQWPSRRLILLLILLDPLLQIISQGAVNLLCPEGAPGHNKHESGRRGCGHAGTLRRKRTGDGATSKESGGRVVR